VTGQLQTTEALTKAIKAMQQYEGLKETGVWGMWPCVLVLKRDDCVGTLDAWRRCVCLSLPAVWESEGVT